eukprot:1159626-Pelagomonas_calceolata.AAC.3
MAAPHRCIPESIVSSLDSAFEMKELQPMTTCSSRKQIERWECSEVTLQKGLTSHAGMHPSRACRFLRDMLRRSRPGWGAGAWMAC